MNEEKVESECLIISVATAAKILGLSLGLTYEMVRQKKSRHYILVGGALESQNSLLRDSSTHNTMEH